MVLSQALINAAKDGDLATIQEWLAGGGDPDDRVGPARRDSGETLLHVVAATRSQVPEQVNCAIVSALLAAGATVDAQRDHPRNTPLLVAVIYGRVEMTRLLCEAGADVNYSRTVDYPDVPLCNCLHKPDVVRLLLRFGADPSVEIAFFNDEENPNSPEFILPEVMALREVSHQVRETLNNPNRSLQGALLYSESACLLTNARMLRPRLRGVFALRALVHRGRAKPTSETPEVIARLVGGSLPDPLAHIVCKFWLGEPPRRRRRSE